jgi:hypothetical protein
MNNKQSVVIGYTGRRGAGKTTAMINDALNYKAAGYEVFTNMKSLTFAHCIEEKDILNLANTDEFRDCALVIDEIQVLFDSRRSVRKQNVEFLYFIQQIRKRNVSLLYTTQFARRVDVGIREHTDIEARPRMIDKTARHGVKLCEVVYEDLTASMNTGIPVYFRKVFIASEVFGLFDTEERIVMVKNEKNKK